VPSNYLFCIVFFKSLYFLILYLLYIFFLYQNSKNIILYCYYKNCLRQSYNHCSGFIEIHNVLSLKNHNFNECDYNIAGHGFFRVPIYTEILLIKT